MKFYVKNFCCIDSEEEIDVLFIPPLLRRKLSLLDKVTLHTMTKVFNNEIQELVFSSQYGEYSRLNQLIMQHKEYGETSPAQFSGSVHNFPVGFFTLYNKLNLPYYALSACEKSFYAGLVKSVISEKETLYTFADVYDGIKAFSAVISAKNGKQVELCNTLEELLEQLKS